MFVMPTLEEQVATAGLPYGRRHDISYRTGLVVQVLGAAVTAVLYPLENSPSLIGIALFEAGVLLSAVYLFTWIAWIKKLVLCSVMIGLAFQAAGWFVAPARYAEHAVIMGIGFVCIGAGGIVGKEAYCFGYREGWLLMLVGFPFLVLANLFGAGHFIVNALGFSLLFTLLLSLTGKKLRQPLMSSCTRKTCGAPDSSQGTERA